MRSKKRAARKSGAPQRLMRWVFAAMAEGPAQYVACNGRTNTVMLGPEPSNSALFQRYVEAVEAGASRQYRVVRSDGQVIADLTTRPGPGNTLIPIITFREGHY